MRSRLLLVWFLIGIGSAASSVAIAASPQTVHAISLTHPPVPIYTYAEAVNAGLAYSERAMKQISGLPECPPPSVQSGPTQVPLEHIGDPPTCFADPNSSRVVSIPVSDIKKYGAAAYGIEFPSRPSKMARKSYEGVGYYYMGAFTSTSGGQPRQGVVQSCEVTNPYPVAPRKDHVSCVNTSSYPFGADFNNPAYSYVAVGWTKGYADGTQENAPTIFTEDWYPNKICGPRQHHPPPDEGDQHVCFEDYRGYGLTTGQFYSFRTRGYWGGGSTYGIIADIWWNNGWQEITDSLNLQGYCQDSAGNSYCSESEVVEVLAPSCNNGQPGADCPNLTFLTQDPSNQIFVYTVQLRVAPGDWQFWTPSLEATTPWTGQTPYNTCWTTQYSFYYGRKGSC